MHMGGARGAISEQKGRGRYSPLHDESLGSSVDEIWFADLPTQTERAAIFEIHIKKRGRDPKKFNIGKLAMLADQFSGAEIEEAIKSAMFDAFDEDKEVTTDHVIKTVETSPPLAQTAPEKIKKVREACDANKWRRSTEIVERATTGRKIEA
jgi:SpoVK/Ycf46/Vps4 family AAA+-type ATPase